MNENKESVLEKQKRRYQFLLELWKVVKGSSDEQANLYVVAGSLGFSLEETWELHSYFSEKGFFAMDTSAMDITLSHRAIVEIENSLTNPQQSTEHFPSTVIQNFNAPVGSVQTGNNNVANVNQNIGQNFSEILEQLAILKNQFQLLPSDEREEAIEVIDAIAVEVQSEKPSKGKIKSFLLTTKDFAVKTGTELAASTLAKLLESQMGIKG